MGVWEEWMGDVKNSLGEAPEALKKEILYPVPLCLKNEHTQLFYHPQQISFGPRHFQLPSDGRPENFSGPSENFRVSENFKSEIAREFNGQMCDLGIISLVENFKSNRMECLLKNYGIEVIGRFPVDNRPDGLSWVLARDGCFVLRVLESFGDQPEAQNEQKTVLHHILKRDNHHPLLNEIVKDMFKLENQLPLWVLEDTMRSLGRQTGGNWFESALKNLSPIEVRRDVGNQIYMNRIHILQLLGEYMVDHRADDQSSSRDEAEDRALMPRQNGEGNHAKHLMRYMTTVLKVLFAVLFFLALSPILIMWFVWLLICSMRESYQTYVRGRALEDELHVPTIEELRIIGVKFKKLEGKGISHIKFDESKATLYLPKFTVDERSEVIVRNLLVMETQWEEKEKAMWRYVVFMNDLVNTSMDVASLRRQGIIANKLGSDDDVARFWNSLTLPATDIPCYEQIDKVTKSINAYRRKLWRILWAQFWSLHCSKPWLVASLLGGLSLLLLTAVQVICLFHECRIRSVLKS